MFCVFTGAGLLCIGSVSAKTLVVCMKCHIHGTYLTDLTCFVFLQGLGYSALGPSLLDLQSRVAVDLETITFLFTAAGVGLICGRFSSH